MPSSPACLVHAPLSSVSAPPTWSALRHGGDSEPLTACDARDRRTSKAGTCCPTRMTCVAPHVEASTLRQMPFRSHTTHVQGVRLNHANFASEEVIFFSMGVKDGQKCPFKDSNVAVIILTTLCRVSSDHPSLTLFAKIFLPWVSPHLHVGWDTALFAGKYPMFT
jgi:hypothetical protein